jgi:ubiquinone/menaquinone biosynthesis C-methylase UbiE
MTESGTIEHEPARVENPGTVGFEDLKRLARLTRRLKRRIRRLLALAPGQRILDVGSGAGVDAGLVARRVGPAGRVVALDFDAALVCQAAAMAAAARRPSRRPSPWFVVGDGARIPYLSGTFHGCYCERVLQHTPDAAAIVREMVRVTRPGGAIVVADTDWATLSIDAPDGAVERRLVQFAAETLRNGYAGRQLRRLMKAAGLIGVSVEPWPVIWTDYATFRSSSLCLLGLDRRAVRAGVLTSSELARFHEGLADADRRGAFFASATLIVARGWTPRDGWTRRPAQQQEEPWLPNRW